MKSLEVSEEKANQRVEEFKRQLKSLTLKLKEAENRAEFAEKTVKKLQKEVDRLEGMFLACFQFFLLLLFFTSSFPFYFKSKQKARKSLENDRRKKIYAKLQFLSHSIYYLLAVVIPLMIIFMPIYTLQADGSLYSLFKP